MLSILFLNFIFTIYKSERISKKDFIVKSKSILIKTCVHKKALFFFQCLSTMVLKPSTRKIKKNLSNILKVPSLIKCLNIKLLEHFYCLIKCFQQIKNNQNCKFFIKLKIIKFASLDNYVFFLLPLR